MSMMSIIVIIMTNLGTFHFLHWSSEFYLFGLVYLYLFLTGVAVLICNVLPISHQMFQRALLVPFIRKCKAVQVLLYVPLTCMFKNCLKLS